MKIPKSFKLFGTTINVIIDDKKCNDANAYGKSNYSESNIYLTDVDGMNPLSEDRKLDSYYHEKVHMILDMMHERDLSNNEAFVDVFGKLLRQSDITSEY